MTAFDYREFETYKIEAHEKWGNIDAYKEHAQKTKHYSTDKWKDLAQDMDHIMAEFARCKENGEAANSNDAQCLVKKLQSHITENFYQCSNEILLGLGQMYVADERFQSNIDKHGEGSASFIRDAIDIYCRK